MSRSEEYRANAAECQRMADRTRNEADKRGWLKMAASWLRMIRQPKVTVSEKFEAEVSQTSTGHTKSDASH